MPLMSSVGKFVSAANQKADQLTAGAKGILCLPSIIAGLPDLGRGLMGSVVSNLASALENAVDTVTNIVTNQINGAVSTITGAIDGLVQDVQNSIDQVLGTINMVKEAVDELVDQVVDIYNFIKGSGDNMKDKLESMFEKENCDFAAATMLNCITAQALGSVTDKAAIDIAKGLRPISSFANDVADKISSPGGALDKIVKKQSEQIDRATKVISKADIF